MIQREADFTATKHEQSSGPNAKLLSNASSSSTTTTTTTSSWSRLKDPRIVRVSRALGGKDRHSKVCTVKGLRDRRVRLSVPTAIQLYDLQERLGLNQPSKVVDWLLNAAKHEIDELPPLQIPTFMQDLTSQVSSHKHGLKISSGFNWNQSTKDVSGETSHDHHRNHEMMTTNWGTNTNEVLERSRQLFNRGELIPPSLMNNNNTSSVPPYSTSSSLLSWDPSNLTLSHPPVSNLGSMAQHDDDQDLQNLNLVHQFPSTTRSHHHHHHQVLVYQPAGMATQAYFPASQIANAEFDDQSTTQSVMMRPFYFNSMTPNLLLSQANYAGSQQNEGNDCDDDHNSPRL